MRILDYTPEHRQACLDLFRSNTPEYFAPTELKDFEGFLDKLESNRDRSDGAMYYYLVEMDGMPAACGGIASSPDGMHARMTWGMVHRQLHRQGVGREFLLFRIRRIRQLFPYSTISLDTTQHSKGFYEKLGFVVTAYTPDFYLPGMHRYDMELRSDQVAL